jgi:hypothetical protein
MYALQALQIDGSWYSLGTYPTPQAAQVELCQHAGFRRRTVQYRIVKI